MGRIVVTGASGLIGRALTAALRADGIDVVRLVRRPAAAPDERTWLADTRPLDPDVLAGADAVVNLNGTSIGRMPWTFRSRSMLLWSRLTPTRTLATAIRHLGPDAPALVNASAVGVYGTAPGRPLTEDAPRGRTFLADVCASWEDAALAAGPHARVALLRSAPVIHPDGVLGPLIMLSRWGVAGRIGPGTQVMPWISLTDEVRAIRHVIDTRMAGPVNLAGPVRATANDLGFALAMRMNRPYVTPAPAWALRLLLGPGAAASLLLPDAHVIPARLAASGFAFEHATVEEAIAAVVPSGQERARSAASSLSD